MGCENGKLFSYGSLVVVCGTGGPLVRRRSLGAVKGTAVDKLIVSCPGCKAKYDVGQYAAGTKFKCKKCSQSLLVPEGGGGGGGGGGGESSKPAKAKARSRPGTRGPKGRSRGGRSRGGRKRERDDYDDEEEERFRPAPKVPNYPLIGGIGAAVLLLLIVGIVLISNSADEAARRARENAKEDVVAGDDIPDPKVDEAAKKDEKKAYTPPKPKKQADTGEFVEEKYAEDDKRTMDDKADAKTIVKRFNLRKKIFDVDSSVKSDVEGLLARVDAEYDDPAAVDGYMEKIEGFGKRAFPAILNAMTRLSHKSAKGQDIGTVLFRSLERLGQKNWQYENEYKYGAFEQLKEKMAAIIEMKELWVKHEKD
jgi:ribosomal protein S27E